MANLSPGDGERREMVNTTRLTLAYVYFELSDYEAALQQLSTITSDYYDFAEVLLTRGWASVKLQDYQNALNALNELSDNYRDYYNIEEAYFLRAQCYLKLGYYDFAVSEYNRVLGSGSGNGSDSADSVEADIEAQEAQMAELREKLEGLETNLISTIPLRGMGRASQLADDPQLLKSARRDMMRTIVKEKETYDQLLKSIERLKKRAQKREMRKKWQAYAEYGKVRALYLKETAPE